MSLAIPPGYSHPAYPNTPDNQAGPAVAAVVTGLVCITLVMLPTIFWVRLPSYVASLSVAVTFYVTQSVLTIIAASYGLGSSESLLQQDTRDLAEELLYASDLFYLLTLSSAHIAVLTCQFCIFGQSNVTKVLIQCGWAINALLTVIALPVVASTSLTLHSEDQRGISYDRWTTVVVLFIVLELLMTAPVAHGLWILQKARMYKIKIGLVFALRLPIVAFAVLRLVELKDSLVSSNPLLDRVHLVMWTQLELAYSLFTAAIPPLVKKSADLNTGLGMNMVGNCVVDMHARRDIPLKSFNCETPGMHDAAMGKGTGRGNSRAGSQERILEETY